MPKKMSVADSGTISFAKFLEETPPGIAAKIDILRVKPPSGNLFHLNLLCPKLQLHCGRCGGVRGFSSREQPPPFFNTRSMQQFLVYFCKNCDSSTKTFALILVPDEEGSGGTATKLGEMPTFGPPTPNRLLELFDDDKAIFLKGRQSENHGLGIGAFSYYRRVVENQRGKLFEQILDVAKTVKASQGVVSILEAANAEPQFSKALTMVKDSIPESLLINGHNPMTLLHDALSEGLHAQSDQECLELATSIRVVLQELTAKVGIALQNHDEIKTAISRLQHRAQKRADSKSAPAGDTARSEAAAKTETQTPSGEPLLRPEPEK